MHHLHARLLVCHIRRARLQAHAVAIAEAVKLLDDLGAEALPGGPLGDQRGLFWLTVPAMEVDAAVSRLPRLGYTVAVDLLEPSATNGRIHTRQRRDDRRRLRWRGRDYNILRAYEEDAGEARERAPDRRTFVLDTAAGARAVRGYRGDGGDLSRRGLPVCDARLLVNLAGGARAKTLLDPFAGAGGAALEAIACARYVFTCDRDAALRFGLRALGARHYVADACCLPFRAASIEAIATEPPYDASARDVVLQAFGEMARVLTVGGRVALLTTPDQAAGLRPLAASLGLAVEVDSAINRKGMDCVALVCSKPVPGYTQGGNIGAEEQSMELKELVEILACPIDKQPVRMEENWIICSYCDAHYPIQDGIPCMLIEEAKYPNGKKNADQPAPTAS